jgi:5-methylcytosine-specific restriction endonuclease McrA
MIDKDLHIKLKQKGFCDRCKKRCNFRELEVHHILPVSKGGNDKRGNLMVLCKPCHVVLDNRHVFGSK